MSTDRYARRFTALTALRWFPIGLVVPVMVLLMQARGLTLADCGRLLAVYSLSAVLLELPTGGLADVVGRRPVLASASILGAAGSTVFALAPSMPLLALSMVLLGAGRALGSGPLEAWYVDAVRAANPEAEIRSGLGRAQAAEAISLAMGSVIGGMLPALAEHTLLAGATGTILLPLSVPFLACAVMLLVHAGAVAVLIVEPSRLGGPRADQFGADARAEATPGAAEQEPEGVAGTVRATVGLVLTSGDLRRLIGYAAVLGVALAGVELVSPAAMGALLGGPDQAGGIYGVLTGAGFGAAAAGAVLSARVARRFRDPRAAACALAVGIAPIALLIGVPALAVASLGYLAFYLFLGANGPLLAGLLHDRVPGSQRSTALSVESLALQLGGVVASVTIGALVTHAGIPLGYVVIALVLLVGALLLARLCDGQRTDHPTPGQPHAARAASGAG